LAFCRFSLDFPVPEFVPAVNPGFPVCEVELAVDPDERFWIRKLDQRCRVPGAECRVSQWNSAPGTRHLRAGLRDEEESANESGESMVGHTAEDIRKETRVYIIVFAVLAALTLITVAVSYMNLHGWKAITAGLVIATIKGSLVAGYFMHLLSEKKLIYSVLILTLVFFSVLMWMPHTEIASIKKPVKNVTQGVPHSVH
jgi:cytochrome c oxidase subunit IV